jgi:hypothetical protein
MVASTKKYAFERKSCGTGYICDVLLHSGALYLYSRVGWLSIPAGAGGGYLVVRGASSIWCGGVCTGSTVVGCTAWGTGSALFRKPKALIPDGPTAVGCTTRRLGLWKCLGRKQAPVSLTEPRKERYQASRTSGNHSTFGPFEGERIRAGNHWALGKRAEVELR